MKPDLGIAAMLFAQSLGRTFRLDLAFHQNRNAVGQGFNFVHIVRGQQDGLAHGVEFKHQAPDIAPGVRIQARGGGPLRLLRIRRTDRGVGGEEERGQVL